jgi:hypothetical protein
MSDGSSFHSNHVTIRNRKQLIRNLSRNIGHFQRLTIHSSGSERLIVHSFTIFTLNNTAADIRHISSSQHCLELNIKYSLYVQINSHFICGFI